LKIIITGADVAMMTSALLKFGPEHLSKIRQQLVEWMEEHEYDSISQMKGSMFPETVLDPGVFVRSNYMKMLNDHVYKSKERQPTAQAADSHRSANSLT